MEILASRVLLRPSDFDASVAFYRDAIGLHIAREFPGGVVFFLGGGFLEVSGAGGPPADDKLQLWLQVRDVDLVHEQLVAAAVEIIEAPGDKPWGLRELRARDPDGVRLVFVHVPDAHPLRRDPRS